MLDKNIVKYRSLYLKDGNTDSFFDYDVFLKLYENYLSKFYLDDPDNHFYMNVELLKYVVDGFEYYHDLFIGNVDVSWDDILSYNSGLFYDLFARKLSGDDTINIAEHIFMSTIECNNQMINTNIIHCNPGVSNKMIFNSCKVNKVYMKQNIKGN